MAWLRPEENSERDGRRARWIYLAVAYVLLIASGCLALLNGTPPAEFAPYAVAAALWLPLLFPLYPARGHAIWLRWGYYIVLVALATALVSTSAFFAAFSAIGYSLAFALFSSWWSMVGVALTAIGTVIAQSEGSGNLSMLTVMLGVTLPLLFAGWAVGVESERRKTLIGRLTAANARITAAAEENAALQAELVMRAREAGVLDERRRLAREIHDAVAQGLIALITQLRAADLTKDDPAEWRRHMDNVNMLAQQSLGAARRSVRALRPEQLERSHLPEAVADLAEQWAATESVSLITEITGTPRPLATAVEVTLFRVAQEALANVSKHAGARRVALTLSYLDDDVLLDVRDDGDGFDPAARGREGAGREGSRREGSGREGFGRGGFGLTAMEQRVRGVGGTFAVESVPGEGTAIAVAVPALPREEGST
ncbi:histidine kinase [Sinosporangium siamense]|uniref:Oxygen sensor histidine kinase NreB n=1 Tax=Sinosporangium siamense TaxID=1367973 RepID=A0A919V6N4_9ACTN|nr:histidine kinase [Sinosporangium siamense]